MYMYIDCIIYMYMYIHVHCLYNLCTCILHVYVYIHTCTLYFVYTLNCTSVFHTKEGVSGDFPIPNRSFSPPSSWTVYFNVHVRLYLYGKFPSLPRE